MLGIEKSLHSLQHLEIFHVNTMHPLLKMLDQKTLEKKLFKL